MINKKKEGGFYASKVKLFLNEYDGVPLEDFCKAEGVSYSKMLNCLGWNSGTKPLVPSSNPRKFAKKAQPVRAESPALELKELVIDKSIEDESEGTRSQSIVRDVNSTSFPRCHFIENISIRINNRIGVNIGKCDVSSLSALIREMEAGR